MRLNGQLKRKQNVKGTLLGSFARKCIVDAVAVVVANVVAAVAVVVADAVAHVVPMLLPLL